MKILIVRGFPERIQLNGYNSQELGLARALRKKGHVCDIVYFAGREQDHIQTMDDGTRIFWQHGVNLLKNGIMPGIRKRIDSYDVIQVNEYDQLESWYLYTFGQKPVVIYNGNYYSPFNRGYNLKCSIFDHTFLKMTGKKRQQIPCMTKSRPGQTFLEDKGFKNVITVGVGLDIESLEENRKHTIADTIPDDPARFELLYVGKFEERRNIPFLLSVIEKAHNRNPQIHATLIGTGSEEYMAPLRSRVQNMLQKGILQYYEKAPQSELASLYEKADMLLLPSGYEIFGMVLLESMYYGCVPLSTPNGGSSVLVEHEKDGFIADLKEEDWVSIILEASEERDHLATMSGNARLRIREHYTWDKLADTVLDVFGKALSST